MPNKHFHRYEFKVADFNQLVKMWLAGNGEFYFKNLNTNKQFCIGFVTRYQPGYKQQPFTNISACLISYNSIADYNNHKKLNLFHVGRWWIDIDKTQLYNNPVLGYDEVKYFMDCFSYMNNHIRNGIDITKQLSIWYSGHCCRCGLELKTAESIARGFGPECSAWQKETRPAVQFNLF